MSTVRRIYAYLLIAGEVFREVDDYCLLVDI